MSYRLNDSRNNDATIGGVHKLVTNMARLQRIRCVVAAGLLLVALILAYTRL
jgi:hypothetical protein